MKTVFPSKHKVLKTDLKKKVNKIMHFRVMNAVNKSVITHSKNSPLWWIYDGVLHKWTQRGCLEINWFCTLLRCAQSFPAIVSKSSLRDLGTNKQQKTLKSTPQLSRWHLLRWCCCPSGAEKTAGLCWRNKSGSSDSGFPLPRCHCSMMWWRTGGALFLQREKWALWWEYSGFSLRL